MIDFRERFQVGGFGAAAVLYGNESVAVTTQDFTGAIMSARLGRAGVAFLGAPSRARQGEHDDADLGVPSRAVTGRRG